jgi:hypothetical protein
LDYKHTDETKLKISKPGKLNPMFVKSHSEESRANLSKRKNKHPFVVGILDLEGDLIFKFNNNV